MQRPELDTGFDKTCLEVDQPVFLPHAKKTRHRESKGGGFVPQAIGNARVDGRPAKDICAELVTVKHETLELT